MKRLVSSFVGLILFFVSVVAHATPSARLVYVRDKGAEECPDEQALRAAVAARLGYDPFFPYAKATLFAEITGDAGTFRAKVKLVDEGNVVRGNREIEHKGPRCADLVDAMALTMSIAIDPRSLTGPVAEPAEPAATEEPPPEQPSPQELEPPVLIADQKPAVVPPPPVDGPHLDAHALGAMWLGAAPSATGGGLFGVELRYRLFAAMLDARVDAKASTEVEQGGTVSTSFAGAMLAPCIGPEGLRACAVLGLGQLTASARGISTPRDDSSVHALLGARFGVAVPLAGPLYFRGQVDLLGALTPQVLRINAEDVYELDRFSIGLGLGLGVRFF